MIVTILAANVALLSMRRNLRLAAAARNKPSADFTFAESKGYHPTDESDAFRFRRYMEKNWPEQ